MRRTITIYLWRCVILWIFTSTLLVILAIIICNIIEYLFLAVPLQDNIVSTVPLVETTGVHQSKCRVGDGEATNSDQNQSEQECIPSTSKDTNNGSQNHSIAYVQSHPGKFILIYSSCLIQLLNILGHSRNSSLELRMQSLQSNYSRSSQDLRGVSTRGHSRTASLDLRHARNSSADLNKLVRNDLGMLFGASST